ncbi:SDR family NAD(P)-dependent oxidoreductase [Hydrogenophaga laconesensis]|uniref:NAD(P)-dependent dehydrogenase (Short-subunit alcohol dehydrogenase family) n=1 Tax=Hydrogenophaga laconesensis TaxID=1805971 RepID=A0ABU1VFB7_9BURK|nr:SDR family NAD(P)-dependent oxidoreductase [Hydrogenophaga laconesensis]MDR7096030.1 NAD(P)-dependent dehydrogenase (short-subunit alcohol dehydrogenase family) [Hydrogenophaga laconesensis]
MPTPADSTGSPFNLEGQRCVVTGAASGIGRAVATALLDHGAEVLLVDRDATALAAVLDTAPPAQRQRAHSGACDITDAARFQRLVDGFGALDALFANAGVSGGPGFGTEAGRDSGTLAAQQMDYWRRVMDINLLGTATCLQAVLPALKQHPQRQGRIVVTASVAGLQAEPFVSYAYALTKAAVVQLVQQTALELAPHGITVNAIAPGFIKTGIANGRLHDDDVARGLVPRIPLGRLGDAADLGGLAVFLASRASAYITGAVIPVDGGYLLNQKEPYPC